MHLRINLLFFLVFLFGCNKTKLSEIEPNYLIEAKELKLIVNKQNIKIIDFRKEDFYIREHINGAIHMWRDDIENFSYPYKGMMPSKENIEKLFGSLGITNADTIIVYDNKGMCEGTRLWWILQKYNFKNIKILHGGIEAWKSINGIVNNKIVKMQTTSFKLPKTQNLQYSISKDEILKELNNKTVIIDTRTLDEFSGKQQKNGAFKPGRIPKSIHIDWANAINYEGDKKLKSLKDLSKIYQKKLNIKKNDLIILYCHSGVRSAHTTFVLTQLLGYKNVKNYDGSWIEWSYYNDLPYLNETLIKIN